MVSHYSDYSAMLAPINFNISGVFIGTISSCFIVLAKKFMLLFDTHLRMGGPHGPLKTFSGVYLVIIGILERTVYLIVHNTEPFPRITNFSHPAVGMPTSY